MAKGFTPCKDDVQAAKRQKTGFMILVKPAYPLCTQAFYITKIGKPGQIFYLGRY
jgi:hypothetical protein